MKKYVYIVLGLFCLISCSKSRIYSKTTLKNNRIEHSEALNAESIQSILYSNIITRRFSSKETLDTFKIYIRGKDLLTGQVSLKILNSKGESYVVRTHSSALMTGFKGKPTIVEKERYLKSQIDSFFKNENFFEPAINETDKFDPDHTNKEIWNIVKSNKSAIGFFYLLEDEEGRKITYIKDHGYKAYYVY